RLDQTPLAALEDPEDYKAEAGRRQQDAERVESGWVLHASRAYQPATDEQDRCDDDRLACEDVEPGEFRRDPAADQRADRYGGARNAADQAEGERPLLAAVGARDE